MPHTRSTGLASTRTRGAGLDQEIAKLRILGELGFVRAADNGEPVLPPHGLVKSANPSPQRFGRPWIGCLQDLSARGPVLEESRLLRHHEVLGRRESLTVHGEGRVELLAETRRENSILARLVTPEEDVLELLSRVEASPEIRQELVVLHVSPPLKAVILSDIAMEDGVPYFR